jgi:putative DNA primase/helicase
VSVVDLPYPFDRDTGISPFSVEWLNAYNRAGWKGVISLPYGKQSPPPKGYTGREAPVAKKDQKLKWLQEAKRSRSGAANLAVVHSELTIAIDVDDYEIEGKIKNGGESLRALEERLGPLPPTWRSSARGLDNPSGQRFYRLLPEHSPRLLDWDDKPGPHIEIVRWGHRYSVVWPSMNGRLGEVYRWHRWDIMNERWEMAEEEYLDAEVSPLRQTRVLLPDINALPLLPEKWVEYLTQGFTPYDDKLSARADLTDDAAREWVLDMPDSDGAPCARMQEALDKALEGMSDGAHDIARDKLMQMMLLAWEGHTGLNTASLALREAFFEEVNGRRDYGAAKAEWYRNYKGAVDRVAARGEAFAAACACWYGVGDGDGAGGAERDPASYTRNDDGNAQHLRDLTGHTLLWCEGYKNWMYWHEDEQVWNPDQHNIAMARARMVGPRVVAAAGKLYDMADTMEEGSKQDAVRKRAFELSKWGEQAGNVGRLKAMLEVMKSYEDTTIPMGQFDADPALLVMKGSTIELLGRGSEEGIRVRDSRKSDYSMHSTGLEYLPWDQIKRGGEAAGLLSGRKAWENYLDTFLPDPELRRYVQRLLGYALYGANPERKIIFFRGPTSTGKSTILEAVSAALGQYASPFNLSMFRDNPNEAPRPDLVHAMPKRVIISTEGDGEWHLHADMIKRITGGTDKLKVRNLFSNEWLVRDAAFVPFIGTNSSPTIQGADAALWRRLSVVPFMNQVLGQADNRSAGHHLTRDLACRMAVLSWVVEGWIWYCRIGLDTEVPEASRLATEEFRKGVSEWHSFMAEAVAPRPGKKVLVQDLYDMYRIWGMKMDVPDRQMLGRKHFDDKLTPNGYDVKRLRKPNSQSKAHYIVGWELAPDPDAEGGRGSSGSPVGESWSVQKYQEIQGSED